MKIYPFKPSFPDANRLEDYKLFFSSVKEHYKQYEQEGYFLKSSKEQVLIYDITLDNSVHTGIICCLDASEISEGNIIRHEMTLKEKEMMMMKLIYDRNANIKPILLTIPNTKSIHEWIAEYRNDESFSYHYDASEKHTLTPVTKKEGIKKITKLFHSEVVKAYIADGHHRCFCVKYLTDKNPEKYGKVLVVFFPFNDLRIKPYNRIVEFSEEISAKRLAEIIQPFASVKFVKKFKQSESRKTFYSYCQGKWMMCRWKKALLNRIDGGSLDLFNHHILNDGLYKTSKKLHYIQGDTSYDSAVDAIDRLGSSAGFFFAPLTFKRLTSILDRGQLVVPKSTYFEPRMRNGITVQDL